MTGLNLSVLTACVPLLLFTAMTMAQNISEVAANQKRTLSLGTVSLANVSGAATPSKHHNRTKADDNDFTPDR